jgi:hypothetical protein
MILEEELIKHKWKYMPESKSWQKLGVTFRDVNRPFNRYNLRFADTLVSGITTSTLSDLEHHIKRCVSIIFRNKRFHSKLSIKQKRTLKNWIL